MGAQDASRPDLDLRVVDLAKVDLPLLCEPLAAAFGQYVKSGRGSGAPMVAGDGAFVLVCPDCNASSPAVLEDALDHLYAEWRNKAVTFVGDGVSGNPDGGAAAGHRRAPTWDSHVLIASLPSTVRAWVPANSENV